MPSNQGKKKKAAKQPDPAAEAMANGFQPISRRSSADELTGGAAPAAKPHPSRAPQSTMSVSELKGELKAGGVNTAGILEKEDLIAAITKLRLAPSSNATPSVVPPERSFQEMQDLLSTGTATCDQCGIQSATLKNCVACFIVAYCSPE